VAAANPREDRPEAEAIPAKFLGDPLEVLTHAVGVAPAAVALKDLSRRWPQPGAADLQECAGIRAQKPVELGFSGGRFELLHGIDHADVVVVRGEDEQRGIEPGDLLQALAEQVANQPDDVLRVLLVVQRVGRKCHHNELEQRRGVLDQPFDLLDLCTRALFA
jgi:hypothetical protein